MIITERSNSIVVRMENDEDFMTCLNEAIHTYHIKQAWIRGFGFGSMIEYGVIEKLEPIFFKKNRIEKLVTIASLTAIVGDENVINNYRDFINRISSALIYDNGKQLSKGFLKNTHL
jgi:hypothetical protein